ncbi:MAG: sigma-70 family RNA polymerase sigma factor [Oscillospiraceae bacterium]|nr:sigma-70 family RNA polymerase sigma factor [Oscillospiraceae bacterium]
MDGQDARLLALFKQRDEQAIAETQAIYGSVCLGIAKHILRNEQDAEECVNDAMMSVWQQIPPAEPQSFRAYLMTVTRNLAASRLEQRNAQKRGGGVQPVSIESDAPDLTAPGADPAEHAEASELSALLERFLNALPQRDRIIFIERFWFYKPEAEIAANYGLSPGNVRVKLSRMKKKLAACLKKEGYHE